MRSKKKNDFEVMVGRIQATSDALQQDALVVINRSVTTRACAAEDQSVIQVETPAAPAAELPAEPAE